MAEIDLEALIAKAEAVQSDRIVFKRKWTGKYSVNLYKYDGPDGVFDVTFDECIKQIRAWLLPPKPNTLTIVLPTEYCERLLSDINRLGASDFPIDGTMSLVLQQALAPYQQPE